MYFPFEIGLCKTNITLRHRNFHLITFTMLTTSLTAMRVGKVISRIKYIFYEESQTNHQ
jgi:hypothetical protein